MITSCMPSCPWGLDTPLVVITQAWFLPCQFQVRHFYMGTLYFNNVPYLLTLYRFVPDKEFAGTDHWKEDPFGLNKFLSEAKRPSNRLET